MKKICSVLLTLALLLPAAALAEDAKVETFAAEYEMFGTTSAGLPKNDTFIFEGETTDGIITKLNFDIIRNKGEADEYSKKDIMGYMMNVSDATVEEAEDGFKLTTFTVYGYDPAFSDGDAYYAQFMVNASCDALTEDTLFQDLTFNDMARPDNAVTLDKALIVYGYLGREAGLELTGETPVKDLLALHGLYADGAFAAGSNRVSFAGYNGGRSYGEQIDAIVAYILANQMTLEDVYEMFRTVNQASTPIPERDVVSGATITFTGDFQRMVYLAIHGELFQGVVNVTENEDGSVVKEVVTQGYGGEVETHVTLDAEGRVTAISVRDAQETDGIGAVLTADGSEYIAALIAGQDDLDAVDAVTGATVTSDALKQAVEFALADE
ncbi:MAG TPA: FMN-binding protein [Candidatus Onthenecus intestinigallinarum]|uniref:FMN-binding protein n=1 Tax=Candidatus Onthenecus intestinigallinarum TaxID=2840875 RepID=A0A9D0ZBG3_9FIRM|nr:FMN-binding protein [Candidatus Onthenecus intestinigallinarum]